MKNLRKWTALAAVMAMTATLFTGCGSTDAPASEATAPAAESTAAATTETGVEAPAADGELAAGSVWEGAMSAGNYKLDNLCAIVDRNRLQPSGITSDAMKQDSQEERWAAFGWNVLSVPGNDMDALVHAFELAKHCKGKPTVIIANTTKGCGSSVMENKAEWHHKVPTPEEVEQIMKDLDERKEALS